MYRPDSEIGRCANVGADVLNVHKRFSLFLGTIINESLGFMFMLT